MKGALITVLFYLLCNYEHQKWSCKNSQTLCVGHFLKNFYGPRIFSENCKFRQFTNNNKRKSKQIYPRLLSKSLWRKESLCFPTWHQQLFLLCICCILYKMDVVFVPMSTDLFRWMDTLTSAFNHKKNICPKQWQHYFIFAYNQSLLFHFVSSDCVLQLFSNRAFLNGKARRKSVFIHLLCVFDWVY